MHEKEKKCVIVGAGFAGAATAYHLTQMGLEDVVILEQEGVAGMHASGRNAAMIRHVVSDQSIAALARGGAAFIRRLPENWPVETGFQQNGSFLLGDRTTVASLQHDSCIALQSGVRAEWWPVERIRRGLSVLEDSPIEGGVWCPTDGVVDIHGLLHGYLKMATWRGAEIKLSSRVCEVVAAQHRVIAVRTETEEFVTDVLVDAAGAWAGEIARLAGATRVPLSSYRRHLFVTEPISWVRPEWPFVWDIAHDIYFRPESGGLLLSPCDETEQPAGIPRKDPAALEMLADKVSRYLPRMSDLRIQKYWPGLRTMTSDRRFVVGWDPSVEGFFWVAGLGGHGVTASYAVGLLAASMILQRDEVGNLLEFSPARFQLGLAAPAGR